MSDSPSEPGDRSPDVPPPAPEPYPGMAPPPPPVAQPGGPAPTMPQEVHYASVGLFVMVAVSLVALAVSLASRSRLTELVARSQTDLSPEQIDTLVSATLVVSAVFGLLFAALYVWLAFMVRRGRNWARITVTILLLLNVLTSITSIGRPAPGVNKVFGLIGLVLAVGVLFYLWRPAATAYFNASRRRPGQQYT